jgi:type VI secretion system secreted protein VgrG
MFERIQARTLAVSGDALPNWGGRPLLGALRLRGSEKLGKLYRYTLDVASADEPTIDAWQAKQLVSPAALIGQRIQAHIEFEGRGEFVPGQRGDSGLGNVGAGRRTVSGLITQVTCTGERGRQVFWRFTVRPWLWLATRNSDSRIFQNMSVAEITDAVLKDQRYSGGLFELRLGAIGLQGSYPKRDYVRQAWESDYAFLTRLWREWGLYFFMVDSTLVIADSPGAHKRHGNMYDVIRYQAPDGPRIDEEHIHEFGLSHALTAGTVQLVDYDYTRPRAQLTANVNRYSESAFANTEQYHFGDFSQPLAGTMGLSGVPNDYGTEAQYLAGVRADALRAKALRAKGRGHLRGLAVGHTFELEEHPLKSANIEYLVVATEIDIRNVDERTQPASEAAQYACVTDFVLQPAKSFFRIKPKKKPHCGAETAIVVGPVDQPMWVDGYARIKIRFVWDRRGERTENASCWVRAAQPWQGNGFGFVALPRVGQEVTVLHQENDPDKPVAVARQVNGFNQPPWKLPGNQALTGWLSRALSGRQSTSVVSDDTPGKLQVQVTSDHADSRLVVGYNTRIEATTGRMEARGEGFEIATTAVGVARANQGMLLTTEAREGAKAPVKDMGETIARLNQAGTQHEELAQLAQLHEAQTPGLSQHDVMASIKSQNDALRGAPATPDNPFPEMDRPDLVLASAAGIAATSTESTHLASRQDHAITAGRDVSISGGRSLLAVVRGAVSILAAKLGMKLIAANGKVEIQAQNDEMSLTSLKDLSITSTDGKIFIAADKEIWIGAGGSYIRITDSSIENVSPGQILEKCAKWDKPPASSMSPRLPDLPKGNAPTICLECLMHAAGIGASTVERT